MRDAVEAAQGVSLLTRVVSLCRKDLVLPAGVGVDVGAPGALPGGLIRRELSRG